ncbi:uncharacterized protein EKO05_0003245 [Ascochyta rabiei]|nr:uncharacterized protein EKO05_0003245 [Ascochyta rabiei]UPX12706.1 hypothetical protein EKO05_0003245 [Ascochyta rabiei]
MFRQFLVRSVAFKTLRAQIYSFVVPEVSNHTRTTPLVEAPHDVEITKVPKYSGWAQLESTTWKMWGSDLAQTLDLLLVHKDFGIAKRLSKQLASEALSLATGRAFFAMGRLEPALTRGLTRLCWTCRCGGWLFSDVKELEVGGTGELAARMENTTRSRVVSATYNKHSSNQQYNVPRHFRWFGSRSGVCQTDQQRPSRFFFTTSSNPTLTALGQ